MQKNLLILLAIGALLVASQAIRAQGEDPFIGTWDIDKEGSDFGGATVPTAMTRTYADLGGGSYMFMVVTINADGQLGGTSATYRFDGKPYPMANLNQIDAAFISYRKPNERTVEYTVTLNGEVSQIGAKTFSLDSQLLTITIQYPNSDQPSQILRFRRRH